MSFVEIKGAELLKQIFNVVLPARRVPKCQQYLCRVVGSFCLFVWFVLDDKFNK